MTHSALYYPGWGIDDPHFMFESLLYWDRLACIVPYDEFRPNAYWRGGFGREAESLHDRFVTGLAPSEEDKEHAHHRLEQLLSTEPPDWCLPENLAPDNESVLAVRKVSPRTITMLERHGWLAHRGDDSQVVIARAAAGVLLGALVAEMASRTMPAITDNATVFRSTCNGLLMELQSQRGIGESRRGEFEEVGLVGEAVDSDLAIVLARIVKLGIEEGELTPAMLTKLAALREDSGFNEQRERFCGEVDRYVEELRDCPVREHKVLHEHWEHELAKDREGLKRELRSAGIRSILDKEGVLATAVGAAAGAGVLAAAGPVGLVIGVGIAAAGIVDSARRRRAEVIEKHWTSWLAAAARPSAFG